MLAACYFDLVYVNSIKVMYTGCGGVSGSILLKYKHFGQFVGPKMVFSIFYEPDCNTFHELN